MAEKIKRRKEKGRVRYTRQEVAKVERALTAFDLGPPGV